MPQQLLDKPASAEQGHTLPEVAGSEFDNMQSAIEADRAKPEHPYASGIDETTRQSQLAEGMKAAGLETPAATPEEAAVGHTAVSQSVEKPEK